MARGTRYAVSPSQSSVASVLLPDHIRSIGALDKLHIFFNLRSVSFDEIIHLSFDVVSGAERSICCRLFAPCFTFDLASPSCVYLALLNYTLPPLFLYILFVFYVAFLVTPHRALPCRI